MPFTFTRYITKPLLLVWACLAAFTVYGQQAAELNRQAAEIINGDPQKSMALATQALAKAGNNELQEAIAYFNIGTAHYYLDDYIKALQNLRKALTMAIDKKQQDLEGKCNGMIGEIYVYTAEYSKSLDYLSKARAIFEANGDMENLARCNNNMGIIHKNQFNFSEALLYFQKAFDQGDDVRKGDASLYMGQVYILQKKFADADKTLQKAVELARKNKDQYVLADAFIGLGKVNIAFGKSADANKYLADALAIKEAVNDQQGIAIVCNTMGNLYMQSNEAQKAHALFLKSANIASKIDTREELKDAYLGLSNTFHLKGVNDSAYLFLGRYNRINEEIQSEEASRKLSQIENALAAEKEKQRQEQERFKNNVYKAMFIGVIIVLLVFGWVMYNRYKLKQRANVEITRQKEEVEKQRAYAEWQKAVIEVKNHEITDSINYARRIQLAVLPAETEFTQNFTDSFILFRPKDIVSGDFYWFTKVKTGADQGNSAIPANTELMVCATADCTGHGVPGGFMSMLGTSLLNEIINEARIYEPAKALDMLREKVIAGLKQTGAPGENKDGMDMVLTACDLQKNVLYYAAANNGLYIIRNGELTEHKADKQPIGFHEGKKPFNAYSVQLHPGDCVYTFTDGYADQFGGPRGKKLKYKLLEQKLLEIHTLPMRDQHKILDEFIVQWMGDLEQNDDICVVGIKV